MPRTVVAEKSGQPRTYQLDIRVARAVRVTVGKLGTFDFPAGNYVYTGSARRGIEARVKRHLSATKRMHWHIDYLLAAAGVSVTSVSLHRAAECTLNRRVAGAIVVERFGASDCKAGCGSHLKRISPTGKQ